MRASKPIIAALIATAMLLTLLARDASAAVEMTEANADQRLGQAESAFRAGRRDEAERLIWEVSGWANHLSRSAGVGDDAARVVIAERMYLRVLTTVGRTFGADDVHAWDALKGLANLYREQKRFAEAESLLHRALTIAQKSPGSMGQRNFAEGTVVSALSTLYAQQGRNADAEAACRYAADLFDNATPPSAKLSRDEALLKCALMLRSAGRRDAAAELEARMLPENRSKVSKIAAKEAWDAAIAESRAGRNAEAERIYKDVVRDAEARGDPILGQAVAVLVLFYAGTKNMAQIQVLCERYPGMGFESFCARVPAKTR